MSGEGGNYRLYLRAKQSRIRKSPRRSDDVGLVIASIKTLEDRNEMRLEMLANFGRRGVSAHALGRARSELVRPFGMSGAADGFEKRSETIAKLCVRGLVRGDAGDNRRDASRGWGRRDAVAPEAGRQVDAREGWTRKKNCAER